MQTQTACRNCKKTFSKFIQNDSEEHRDASQDICYDCALESLTKGQSPEEGDFNTARIISGEISDDERRLLQEDLEKVDWAACQLDPADDQPEDDWSWLEERDGE